MQLSYILDMIIGNYPTGDTELENWNINVLGIFIFFMAGKVFMELQA